MGRRRGADEGAFTFDLEPEGDEEDATAPEPRAPRRTRWRRARPQDPSPSAPLLIDLSVVDDVPPDPQDAAPAGAAGGRDAGDRVPGEGGLPVAVRRARGLLHGRRLLAGVVVATLALTAVVVDTIGDRGRVAALRSSPGGVLELSERPHELWRVEVAGDVPGGLVGVAEGAVVVQVHDELLGVDAASGEHRWQADLPEGVSSCGPGLDPWTGRFHVKPVSAVVCVSTPPGSDPGRSDRATVTVVDAASGEVVAQRPAEVPEAMLFAGPDGGLVVAQWVGDAPRFGDRDLERLTVDELLSGAGEGLVTDGYDLQVRLEDAATGKQRWQRTVRFDSGQDVSSCVAWNDDGTQSAIELRGTVQTVVLDRVLWVGGCGIDAWFTPSGVRLDRGGDPSASEGFSVLPLPSGGYVAQQEPDFGFPDRPGRLLRDDGSEVRSLDGTYLMPQSTDGGGGSVRLLRRSDRLVATGEDGEQLWSAGVAAAAVSVQTSRVAVVLDDTRGVIGLDLGTGDELWAREELFDDVDPVALAYGPYLADGMFTDGRLAAFVVRDYVQGDVLHWIAVDVTSGEELWRFDVEGEDWGFHVAVDGHLVRWSPTAIVGLG
ncbi:PQQ-binding-like beta-propeller repeat protein [Isoptericola sp. NEAU-Y5]|uniref:PQQ-binding-like beta-propeller repeat protein n=1 Tax=Isoptericola luteus TaxID=2879484 RepID=A0ABS7ZHG0_9MICO|nr:PQQ-binding-like beta-propeller repeat protein [Isoptericola sp. NEAU-Y5]MCA5894461.1 PQQ-binding-like beta-propeller repeat protein [Isoptericola sp. NEAU-Y5]